MFARISSLFCFVAVVVVLAFCLPSAGAADVRFRLETNDVVAFLGGEDVVEMQRNGYMELVLTLAYPTNHLRFRYLAWEGDTVFEQRRDLNFPPLAKQLERVGATVVIAQFGQSESLRGTNALPEFVKAYEKLLDAVGNGGRRRVILLEPTPFEAKGGLPLVLLTNRVEVLAVYAGEIRKLADRRGIKLMDFGSAAPSVVESSFTRDGMHLSEGGHMLAAAVVSFDTTIFSVRPGGRFLTITHDLLPAIQAKNKLWFDYWRPQNWAFLAGDRTTQPSSRDHLDPKKRWFPEELEKFLPLIEAKEKEIWEQAAKFGPIK